MVKGKQCRGGFTLVELLIVIAIVGVLLSLLIPTLSRSKEQARRVMCATQLKQLQLAFFMYDQDVGRYPPSIVGGVGAVQGFMDPEARLLLDAYDMTPPVFFCPSGSDYGLQLSLGAWDRSAPRLGVWGGIEVPTTYVKPGGSGSRDYAFGVHYNHMYTNPRLDIKPIPMTADDPGGWVVQADKIYYSTRGMHYLASHTDTAYGSGISGRFVSGGGGGYVLYDGDQIAGGNQVLNDGSAHWKPYKEMNANYIRDDNRNYW